MKITRKVKKILDAYTSDSPAIISKLYQILMSGKLAGSGKLVILPVDQGFEHGPDRSFYKNADAYDPEYHFKLAIDAGMNAYAAPIGFLSACAGNYAGQIPTILKMNSNNSLNSSHLEPNQAITGTVEDALQLGCSAVGLTIYPGSDDSKYMLEEAKEIIAEAKSVGLASVVWSYPRGSGISKEGETAIDVCAYAAHIAAQLGAHIVKVKPPTSHIEKEEAKILLKGEDFSSLSNRVKHVVRACFNGNRMIVFSGGSAKNKDEILNEIKEIHSGGATGSIIGRNSFQREKSDAVSLISDICSIYRS